VICDTPALAVRYVATRNHRRFAARIKTIAIGAIFPWTVVRQPRFAQQAVEGGVGAPSWPLPASGVLARPARSSAFDGLIRFLFFRRLKCPSW